MPTGLPPVRATSCVAFVVCSEGCATLAKRLLTLDEFAAYLDVSCESLLKLIEQEDNAGFPGVRIGGEWLVPLDEDNSPLSV